MNRQPTKSHLTTPPFPSTTLCRSELTFRDATASDIAALVPLVTSAYRGDASRAGWTTEADFLDGNRIDHDVLRADIERPRSRVVLAERNGALLDRKSTRLNSSH